MLSGLELYPRWVSLCNLRMFIEVWPNSKPRLAVPPQVSQAHVTRAHKSVGVALQATVHDMKGVTGSHSSYTEKTQECIKGYFPLFVLKKKR